MSDEERDERIVRDRIVDAVPSTYGQDAFDRILSRLQAAEALLDDATGSGATYYELQRRIHELQEALEVLRPYTTRIALLLGEREWQKFSQALHPTQNEGSRT